MLSIGLNHLNVEKYKIACRCISNNFIDLLEESERETCAIDTFDGRNKKLSKDKPLKRCVSFTFPYCIIFTTFSDLK